MAPRALKLTASAEVRGRCEADGKVRVHRHLIHVPPTAMSSVMAHELVHLERRHHGEAFWRRLRRSSRTICVARRCWSAGSARGSGGKRKVQEGGVGEKPEIAVER